MCEHLVGNRKCLIPSGTESYCHVHSRSGKLVKKVKAQAEEITILNKRLSDAIRKLHIIDQADRIKYELAPYVEDRGFRQAIDDPNLKDIVERVFGAPQSECQHIYDSLINKRNMLTHRYTSRDWAPPVKKMSHGKSIKQLCQSVKTYDILKRK